MREDEADEAAEAGGHGEEFEGTEFNHFSDYCWFQLVGVELRLVEGEGKGGKEGGGVAEVVEKVTICAN